VDDHQHDAAPEGCFEQPLVIPNSFKPNGDQRAKTRQDKDGYATHELKQAGRVQRASVVPQVLFP
jgi:hypothetical protein